MDLWTVVSNSDAAKWVSAAAATVGAYLGFKTFKHRTKETQLQEAKAEAERASALDARFDKKADATDLEGLAEEVSGKADAIVTARDTVRLEGEIGRLRTQQGAIFEQMREDRRDSETRHREVMASLLNLSERLPPQRVK